MEVFIKRPKYCCSEQVQKVTSFEKKKINNNNSNNNSKVAEMEAMSKICKWNEHKKLTGEWREEGLP